MKSIFVALFSILLFSSCSNDSGNKEQSFFNLRQGNLWVYKRYNSPDNVTYTFSNLIDSVRVTGDTLIQGVTYSKLQHKLYHSGTFGSERVECLRVNSQNHLVDQNNQVHHSGTDFQYIDERQSVSVADPAVVYGTIVSQVQQPFVTNVEGVDYLVNSFYGDFTPLGMTSPTRFIFYQYKAGLGLVCQHCSSIASTSCYEDRLVYYEVN